MFVEHPEARPWGVPRALKESAVSPDKRDSSTVETFWKQFLIKKGEGQVCGPDKGPRVALEGRSAVMGLRWKEQDK